MTYDYQAELDLFAEEDKAADERLAFFKALGISHAAFAIDQIDAYEDSRSSHEENLYDTLAAEHKGIANVLIEAAIDAYNATWDARQ